MKGGARAYNHRLNFVAMQRMYGKSSAKFKYSIEGPCVSLNSHYRTKVLQKKKKKRKKNSAALSSLNRSVVQLEGWCCALRVQSYFKHSRNEYKWDKLPDLS